MSRICIGRRGRRWWQSTGRHLVRRQNSVVKCAHIAPDLGYIINQAMFRRNGGAGFVLKPPALRPGGEELLAKRTKHYLDVTVCPRTFITHRDINVASRSSPPSSYHDRAMRMATRSSSPPRRTPSSKSRYTSPTGPTRRSFPQRTKHRRRTRQPLKPHRRTGLPHARSPCARR